MPSSPEQSSSAPSNAKLFERARKTIPGGVNSPVRAYGPVGGTPRFIQRAKGCHVVDAEGREYIDYVGSWGPMILGHAYPAVLEAVRAAMDQGTSFGAPTEIEIELAEQIVRMVPNAQQVRLVSSGTEATMTALRLARGITDRPRFIKFEGCYHGHSDSFLVAAGSGAASHGSPSSPGVPGCLTDLTLLAPFNDLAAVERLFAEHGPEIAGVFVEPIAGNMGCIPPVAGFLEGLRSLCDQHGALLIFDEVMTGFRVHPASAQGLYDVAPDLTTLGKIVGGGLPVGAIAGTRERMNQLSPDGPIYQAGTLSGNPLSVAAGLATLKSIEELSPGLYEQLEETTRRLCDGLGQVLSDKSIPHQIHQVGSMFGLFFSEKPVQNFDDAKACDTERFKRFFHAMLDAGVYLAPSPFEAGFVSAAHDDLAIDRTLEAVKNSDF